MSIARYSQGITATQHDGNESVVGMICRKLIRSERLSENFSLVVLMMMISLRVTIIITS